MLHIPPLDLLVPDAASIAVILASWAVCASFIGLGRLVTGGRVEPEVGLFVGWGVSCVALTIWGALTMASLRIPGWSVLLLGLVGWLNGGARPSRADCRALLRMLAITLPIWLVMATARPSLPDTFTNFLPNAVYIFEHGYLPADTRAVSSAIWPALPYNLTFEGFLASLPFRAFQPASLIFFNVAVQSAFALFLARLLAHRDDKQSVPGWSHVALGLLMTTALNPGFTPKFEFSSYSEGSTAAVLALIGWYGWRLFCSARNNPRPPVAEVVTLGFLLAAFINIREANLGLAPVAIIALCLCAVLYDGLATRRGFAWFMLALVPFVATLLPWRLYVRGHFATGELLMLPFSQWHPDVLPATFASIGKEVLEKITLFLGYAVVVFFAFRGLTRRYVPSPRALFGFFALCWAGYVGFLLFMYVSHFPKDWGEQAHSFFRYNTHLSLTFMLCIAVLLRGWDPPRWLSRAGRPAIGIALVLPFVLIYYMRFDLEMPYPLLWNLARKTAGDTHDGDHLIIEAPGDNGSAALTLRAFLTMTPFGHPDLDVRARPSGKGDDLNPLASPGVRPGEFVLQTCVDARPDGSGAARLLREESGRMAELWRFTYPPAASGWHWTPAVTSNPVCRPDPYFPVKISAPDTAL